MIIPTALQLLEPINPVPTLLEASPIILPLPTTIPIIPTMATLYMPGRGERSAPTFDKSKPHKLIHFFDELEHLFICIGVTNETEKKDAC